MIIPAMHQVKDEAIKETILNSACAIFKDGKEVKVVAYGELLPEGQEVENIENIEQLSNLKFKTDAGIHEEIFYYLFSDEKMYKLLAVWDNNKLSLVLLDCDKEDMKLRNFLSVATEDVCVSIDDVPRMMRSPQDFCDEHGFTELYLLDDNFADVFTENYGKYIEM